ncbi:hypothetical protein OG223_53750 [Streptomyces sp. NBC_01478]|uniref:hypothetical protein n=1 Tax=Streptomyces sp. NBC_01478 TaxID=2903882 RepID=UPI002E36C7FF|nr:hypothetical protein [Streptomyces sp. NBC_01478]
MGPARKLWKAAAIEKARPHLAGRGLRAGRSVSRPSLGQALTRLSLRAGQPSYSAIERATGADGHRVPRSTAHLSWAGTSCPAVSSWPRS